MFSAEELKTANYEIADLVPPQETETALGPLCVSSSGAGPAVIHRHGILGSTDRKRLGIKPHDYLSMRRQCGRSEVIKV